jgi:hypothetical protein
LPRLEEQEKGLRKLSDDLKTFKDDYTTRKTQDSYRFAEIAENEDFKLNNANTNRVLITGIRMK